MVIDPKTGQPTKPTKPTELSDEMILRALSVLQMKIDGIAQQMYNTSIVIEYVMELMSAYEVDGKFPLEIVPERLAAFADERTKQLQEEMKSAMAAQFTPPQTVDLDE